jgi:peptide-methionine (S)-S-oxide reductase
MRMVLAALALLMAACGGSAGTAGKETDDMGKSERAMFAAGCFWGVQDAFDRVPGVTATTVGYTGGRSRNHTYKDVCSDTTGHAEAVLVEYDPARVSYGQLLDVFWRIHDPTTLNRQGPDTGSQYRSAVFHFTPEQQAAAEAGRERLRGAGKAVATEVAPAGEFWRAEEYHQKYHARRGGACGIR